VANYIKKHERVAVRIPEHVAAMLKSMAATGAAPTHNALAALLIEAGVEMLCDPRKKPELSDIILRLRETLRRPPKGDPHSFPAPSHLPVAFTAQAMREIISEIVDEKFETLRVAEDAPPAVKKKGEKTT
jgi:hypothetical protein